MKLDLQSIQLEIQLKSTTLILKERKINLEIKLKCKENKKEIIYNETLALLKTTKLDESG